MRREWARAQSALRTKMRMLRSLRRGRDGWVGTSRSDLRVVVSATGSHHRIFDDFLGVGGRVKRNWARFYDRLRKGRVDGGTEEKDEHVPPHSLAQRLCSMPGLGTSSGLYQAVSCAGQRGRRQKYNRLPNHGQLTSSMPFGWSLPEGPSRLLVGANTIQDCRRPGISPGKSRR